ncbi:spore germination protein GerW family protein [Leucobacter sp. GX24907]
MAHITKEIAETVSTVGVDTAYGEAIDLDGTTVLPVALAAYGFGAGEGGAEDGAEKDLSGSGGGGGGYAVPIGAYVSRSGVTRFEPNTIALLAVAIPLVWVAGRAVGRILRGLRGKR